MYVINEMPIYEFIFGGFFFTKLSIENNTHILKCDILRKHDVR